MVKSCKRKFDIKNLELTERKASQHIDTNTAEMRAKLLNVEG